MDYRVGIGYDIHRFTPSRGEAPDRKLVLGGVEIPDEPGLEGHSDADVVIHAICDALLGAVGKGDIGEHFPNTDPKFKGVASSALLKRVNEIVQDAGYKVGNVDCTIIAQAPNLKAYKPKMRFQIAYKLAIDEERVNIKATTPEGLGALGRGEGIAVYAAALVVKQ